MLDFYRVPVRVQVDVAEDVIERSVRDADLLPYSGEEEIVEGELGRELSVMLPVHAEALRLIGVEGLLENPADFLKIVDFVLKVHRIELPAVIADERYIKLGGHEVLMAYSSVVRKRQVPGEAGLIGCGELVNHGTPDAVDLDGKLLGLGKGPVERVHRVGRCLDVDVVGGLEREAAELP